MQQGGDFLSGFASRVLGSWASSAFQLTPIGQTKGGMLAFSGLSGDLGAESLAEISGKVQQLV